MLDELGVALNSKPTAAEDRDADPSARGETAAESFNDAYDDIPRRRALDRPGARRPSSAPSRRDLARLIDGTARTTGALIRNEDALQDLITNFNATMAAFASESGNLRAIDPRARRRRCASANRALRVAQRGVPVRRARSRARSSRASARRRRRSRRRSRGSRQARPLMGPSELGGLAARAVAGHRPTSRG